ncbi:ABC-type amino acid transport substrate-binding protein [Kordiimonas lacus]|uniref:ABC-type amino acid transport substrate-binding protein n=2 Tax=Kordiimonas lacus TaxID=637679 RepID=A0A1G7BBN7_9PROT|nr:ABC-type amino acid transport substrate-binding protein [Kordiimonas lacus]
MGGGPASADDQVSETPALVVAGFLKEGRFEKDGTGHYVDLVRALLAETQVSTQLVTMPVKRMLKQYEDGEVHCMVPVSFAAVKMNFPSTERAAIVESVPVDYITAHIVTKPGTPPVTDVAALKGKRLAAWVGVPLELFLPNLDAKVLRVESEESGIRLLMSGRVDAIWSWVPDAFILFDRMGYGTPSLAIDKPLFSSTAHVLCHRSAQSEALIKDIDAGILAMRADGRLKEIFGPYVRIVGVDVPVDIGQ